MEINVTGSDTSKADESNKDWKIKCPICLGNIINNSFTESCCHEYCFTCLAQWSKVKAECPMCKKSFKKIMHNVRSNSDFDTYEVVQENNPFPPLQTIDHIDFHSFRGYRTTQRHARRQPARPPTQQARDVGARTFRRLVYSTDSWVLPPADARVRRDVSSAFLRSNPACLHRLYPWLYRDLDALGLEHPDPVVSQLVAGALAHDLADARFLNLARAQLGTPYAGYAAHFVHELLWFARSAFDAYRDYDHVALYRLNGVLLTCETYPTRTHMHAPDSDLHFENASSWTNGTHFVMIPPPMVSYNFSLTSTDPFVRISHTGLIDVNDINNSLIETYINDQHHQLLPNNANGGGTRFAPRNQGNSDDFPAPPPDLATPSSSSSGTSEVQIIDEGHQTSPRARVQAPSRAEPKTAKPHGPRPRLPVLKRVIARKLVQAGPPSAPIGVKREVDSDRSSFCEVLDALPPIKHRVYQVHTVVEYSNSSRTHSQHCENEDDDNMPLETLKRVWKREVKPQVLPQAMVQPGTSKQYDNTVLPPRPSKNKGNKRKARGKFGVPTPKLKTRADTGEGRKTLSNGSSLCRAKGASESGDSICEVYRSPIFEMASFLSRLPLIDHQERTMAWVRCYTQWWNSKDREVRNGFYAWTNEEPKLIWSLSKVE